MFEVIHKEPKEKREFKTIDIVRRLKVITADRIRLVGHPVAKPATIFNPSLAINGDQVRLYARIILGYYTYSSAVAQITLPLSDIYSNSNKFYEAEIKVYPDCKYDYWGVEDPRVYELEGELLMTYCGRTVNYFNPIIKHERTLPVTAAYKSGKWKKILVFRMPEKLKEYVISDKNAFLVKEDNELLLFHRLHLTDGKFYLTISKVSNNINTDQLEEIRVQDTLTAFEPADFEQKVGWATPPIKIDNENLILLHGVDRDTQSYRVFAVLTHDSKVAAITPNYIMAPKEIYEIYGDRPHVVFPCGAAKIDDTILISYGATDSVIGIGEIDISEIMSILDKNRL
jgi:predicted GH43/DUF377 family glycosyl hydrolase